MTQSSRFHRVLLAVGCAALSGACPESTTEPAATDVAEVSADAQVDAADAVSTADADASAPDGVVVPDADVVEAEVAALDADATTTTEADAGSMGAVPFTADNFGGYADQQAFAAAVRDGSGDPAATFNYIAQANGTVTLESGDTPTGSGQFVRITYDIRDPGGSCGQDAAGTGTSINVQSDSRNTGNELWFEATVRFPDGVMWTGNETCYNEVKLALPVANSTRLSAYLTTYGVNQDTPGSDVGVHPFDTVGWSAYAEPIDWTRVRFHYRVNTGQTQDVWEMWGETGGAWNLVFRSDPFDFGGESIGALTFIEYLNERGIEPWRADIAEIKLWDADPAWPAMP